MEEKQQGEEICGLWGREVKEAQGMRTAWIAKYRGQVPGLSNQQTAEQEGSERKRCPWWGRPSTQDSEGLWDLSQESGCIFCRGPTWSYLLMDKAWEGPSKERRGLVRKLYKWSRGEMKTWSLMVVVVEMERRIYQDIFRDMNRKTDLLRLCDGFGCGRQREWRYQRWFLSFWLKHLHEQRSHLPG